MKPTQRVKGTLYSCGGHGGERSHLHPLSPPPEVYPRPISLLSPAPPRPECLAPSRSRVPYCSFGPVYRVGVIWMGQPSGVPCPSRDPFQRDSQSRSSWLPVPAPLLTSSAASAKSLNLPELCFPHPQSGNEGLGLCGMFGI